MTVTLRFQSTGAVPGSGEPIVMRGVSMTIGRGEDNDLVLPDPDRMVSKTHCVIEDHNGHIVVVDLSTNGTFLNYGKIPIGKTPTPLNAGDILTLGPYEIVVDITSSRDHVILDPLADDPVSHGRADRAPDPLALLDDAGPGGDFLDGLLGPGNAPKGPAQFRIEEEDPFDQLLAPLGAEDDPFFGGKIPDDPGLTARDDGASTSDAFRPQRASPGVIPDDWDDLLDLGRPEGTKPVGGRPPVPEDPFATPSTGAADPFAPPSPALIDPFETGRGPAIDPSLDREPPVPPPHPVHVPPPAATGQPAVQQAMPPATSAAAPGDAQLARAFIRALGAGDVPIADADLEPTMLRLAAVLKTMVTGIREILMTRSSIKGEFRIEQTVIGAAGNNPLKFSVSPEQALEAMVKPSSKGYLGAEAATEQALQDIKAHEVAMVTGMEAALKGVLKRLDPKVLEEAIGKRGGVGFLQNRKARYWETYETMYAEISDQAENQFHELFSREFALAYKAQLERLK